MSVVDEIKARIDIVDLIGETVELRRSGKNYVGFCPFHHNTRTPAFVVFPETQTWRCFGACNTGGDVFTFVMKKEGWDFRQALQYLAQRAGVSLKGGQAEESGDVRLWRQLLEEAVTLYRDQLFRPQGAAALRYLESRGLQRSTIEAFALGYAPGGDFLVRYFTQKGVDPNTLVEIGLARARDDGRIRDLFHRRILFPIRDLQGRTVGFGARTLDPDGVPKYINSPTTPLFDKGRLLYGGDRARAAIRRKDRVVLVEGYMDVLALHQAGFEETVSPMGTALTREQMRLLQRLTRRVYLALDPDPAGEKALWRSLDVARETATVEEPVLDARGLVQYEQRLQLELRVVLLPEGKDPDEVVLEDPAAWERLLAQAQPLVLYLMQRMAESLDLKDPKARARLVEAMLPLIRMVANPAERQAYLEALAEYVHTPVAALKAWRPRQEKAPRRGAQSRPAGSPVQPLEVEAGEVPLTYPVANPLLLERYLLALLWHHPEMLPLLQRRLREHEEPPLQNEDFEDAVHRQLWQDLVDALDQIDEPATVYLERRAAQDPALAALVPRLEALYRPVAELLSRERRRLQEAFQVVLRLRRQRVVQTVQYLYQTLSQNPASELEAQLQSLLHRRRKIEMHLEPQYAVAA